MKIRYIYIACVAFLSVACSVSPIERALVAADSLMFSNADSALKILQTIDPLQPLPDQERAYYTVLHAEAAYRSYLPVGDDEALLNARDYYLDQGDRYMLGRTLYCLGFVHNECRMPFIALEDFKQAEPLIESGGDVRRQALINSNIGYLYYDEHFSRNAIYRFNKAADQYRSLGDSVNLGWQYGLLACAYRGICETDTAEYYNDQAFKIGVSSQNHRLISQSMIYRALIAQDAHQGDKAKAYLADYVAFTDNELGDDCFQLLASIAFDEAKYDSAFLYLSKMETLTLSGRELRSRIKCNMGDLDGAMVDYNIYRARVDEVWDQRESSRVDEIEARYDNGRLIREKEVLRHQFILWGVVSGLFVLVLILLVVLIRLRYDKREQGYLDTIEALKNQPSDNTLVEMLSDRQYKLRQAIERRLSIVGELIALSYVHKNNSRAFASKFNELVTQNPLDSRMLDDILDVVNNGYGGLIDYLRDKYGLSQTEQIVAALSCVGLNSHQLYIILGYPSVEKIYYHKNRINTKIGGKGDLRQNLIEISESLQRK